MDTPSRLAVSPEIEAERVKRRALRQIPMVTIILVSSFNQLTCKNLGKQEQGGYGGLRMAVKDDDDFRSRRGFFLFLLEDADNVVILRTCNGQRRRCHRRPGPFPPFALTEMRKRGETFLLGKTRFCERAVLGSLFLPFSSTPTKLPLGCSSRTVPFSADQS